MRMSWARLGSILFATALLATACTGADEGGAGEGASVTPVGSGAGTPSTAPETATGAFLLDLATAETTPLPESLAEGATYVASPDGGRLAYTRQPYVPGGSLEIANLDGTDVRTIEPSEGRTISDGARWSPDGTMLVYQENDGVDTLGNLFVHDLASGERTRLTDLPRRYRYWFWISASFSLDGRSVIFHLPRSGSVITNWDAWSVPVSGGEPTLVLRNATFPLYLPDGERIAFVVPAPDNFGDRIAIVSADGSGSRRTLVDAGGQIWWPTISPDGTRIAYAVDGSIHVVDVSTGETSEVAGGSPR
jgi:Tol biopolymer transport system component